MAEFLAKTAFDSIITSLETLETNMETLYDNFDDRYLGAKTSDPSVDNDGNALIDGALYFNTTSNTFKFYDLGTTTWIDPVTAAETAKTAAETALDEFDDTYLGAKASDPTVDNDGDALVEGAIYWNSTDKELKAYDGSNWQAQSTITGVKTDDVELVATAGQTTFNVTYTVGQIWVLVNGAKLETGEYTAANGTSVVLDEAADAGDIVTIIKFEDPPTVAFGDISTLTEKTSLVDADSFAINDSADADSAKKTLWSTVKSTLVTYFDTLYATLSGGNTLSGNQQFNDLLGIGGAAQELSGWNGKTVNVKSASGGANVYLQRTDNGGYVNMGLASNYQFRSNRALLFVTIGSEDISFWPNSVRAMTVKPGGNVGIGTDSPDTKAHVDGAITQNPLSADPADPDIGSAVEWISDGTGTGDAGDKLIKTNVGGVVKIDTLNDYSV